MSLKITPSYQYFRDNPKPYYAKGFIQLRIKRSDTWVRKWSDILMYEIELEDFKTHYQSNSPLNFHQACCLAIISDWKRETPSMSDSQLKDLILENLDFLTIESIMADTISEYQPSENQPTNNQLLTA